MQNKRLLLSQVVTVFLTCAANVQAQPASEKNLALDANIAPNGRAIELHWFDAQPARVGPVSISRRSLGDKGGSTWRPLVSAGAPVLRYTDDTIRPGNAYEYRVIRQARDIVDVGYWAAGVQVPETEFRGTAYLIVDQTIAKDLQAHLARFARDLTGDGWRVVRRDVPRGVRNKPLENINLAAPIRAWLSEQFQQDQFGQHAAILVGHVPLVLSGRAAPDGHELQAHATDLFYADVDSRWRIDPNGNLLENSVPDSRIEMQIGRIDFSPISGGWQLREVRHLRQYFDRLHHWRMGYIGDPRGAYAQSEHLITEQRGLDNIVGPNAVVRGGHHDAGAQGPWLWGVDFGSPNEEDYAGANGIEAAFAINFGSNKQEIERHKNRMTLLLADDWYPIAVGWGGRPSWRLHIMALGATIGEVHRRTVNNGVAEEPYRDTMDYFPTGRFLWRNPVWVNLLGDPTARGFVLQPPRKVTRTALSQGVMLNWQPSLDQDTLGYRIYRAASDQSGFQRISGAEPVVGTTFTDPEGTDAALYMVRAYGLKDVYAGSFYTLSQGAFALEPVGLANDVVLRTPLNTAVILPEEFTAPDDAGVIHALIEKPQVGTLSRANGQWTYTPPDEFAGEVQLRFTRSDAWTTQAATIRISIGED